MAPNTRFFRALTLTLIFLSTNGFAQSVRPLTDRIDAIVAHPLVLPIQLDDPKSARTLTIRLDDSRHVPASAFFVWATATQASTNWTKVTPIWNLLSAEDYLRSPPTSPGTWIAIIELPIDAVGQGIWIGETRYEPNWLPSPLRVLLETSSRANDGFWDAALTEQQQAPLVQHAITNLRADPFSRWRGQLMTEGFHPEIDRSTGPAQTDRDLTAIHTELLQSDSTHVLDAIADHFAARWQIILGRIWLIDPGVAHRLKHQLTRTATASSATGTTIAPLWIDDTSQLSKLAHDLLSPFVNDELRVERVTTWLDSQPNSLSWIIDDAGFPTRDPITVSPTIGLLWLTEQAAADGFVRIQSAGMESVVQNIPAGLFTSSTVATPTIASRSFERIDEPREISVQIDRQRVILNAQRDMPIASPPGIIVGPLLMDWTLGSFGSRQSGLGVLPPTALRTAGLIDRTANLSETDHRVGWRLYLECAIDPSTNQDTTINLWLGPYGLTNARWTISKHYGLVESRTNANITTEPAIKSVTQGDRWILEVQLPPEVVSHDGFLLLGLERTDEDAHSAWPRRMMPWQAEPGRFVIDTTSWMGSTASP